MLLLQVIYINQSSTHVTGLLPEYYDVNLVPIIVTIIPIIVIVTIAIIPIDAIITIAIMMIVNIMATLSVL